MTDLFKILFLIHGILLHILRILISYTINTVCIIYPYVRITEFQTIPSFTLNIVKKNNSLCCPALFGGKSGLSILKNLRK